MRLTPGGARVTVILLVGMAATLSPARAQSVGETARLERERRAKTTKPAKVYTDADLLAKRSSRPDAEAASSVPSDTSKAGSADAPAASATPAKDEAAERKRLEADWRVRFALARSKIAEEEQRCWHSVVRTVFVGSIPVQQWVKEFEESEELRQARKALADLEEEFRVTGLPPGWTRE